MRSRKLLDAYSAIVYWYDGFHRALWYRARTELTTEEQRKLIREAENLTMEAKRKLEQAFGPEIGKAFMAEVRR
jgi:hypothetical protein